MRLNEVEFRDWCRKNQVTKAAKVVIERVRNSEPSRRVRSGSHSVSGAFPSRKMRLTFNTKVTKMNSRLFTNWNETRMCWNITISRPLSQLSI
jgi:hypothetical protein